MLKSKKIDRVCCLVLACTMLLAAGFTALAAAGKLESSRANAQTYGDHLFTQDTVHRIDISMDAWDEFIQNCTDEEYRLCTLSIDGENQGAVAIRAKGNTSLSSVAQYGNNRYSFKVEFDHYQDGKTYRGLDKLSLNNLIQDATYMKDYWSYTFMGQMGVASPLCSYTEIYVNGEYWGLYLAVEGVEDAFLERNYGADSGNLYKPDSMSFGGGRGNGKGFDMDQFRQNNATDADNAEATLPEMPEGMNFGDGQTPPEMPDGMNAENGQTPPDMPQGMDGFDPGAMPGGMNPGGQEPGADANGQTALETSSAQPEATDGNTPGADQTPGNGTMPEMPEGMNPGDGQTPPEMPEGMEPGAMPGMGEGFDLESLDLDNLDLSSLPSIGGLDFGSMDEETQSQLKDFVKENRDELISRFAGGFGGGGFGGGMGSSDVKLQYIDDDPESYSNIFDNAKTKTTQKDKTRLIASLKKLSEYDLSVVDTDSVAMYMAVHNFVCNGDSYTGSMVHNYYLYEKNGVMTMIPWDYNLAFGGFSGGDATSAVNTAIDTLVSGGSDSDRPMAGWISASEESLALYHEKYAQFISQVFDSGWFEEEFDRVTEMLAPYVEKNENGFYSYEEFQTGAETLKQFCLLRAQSVQGQLDGTVPATSAAQTGADSLVDASAISLNDMGGMDQGRSQNGTDRKNRRK